MMPVSVRGGEQRICLGYGEKEGVCTNIAGTPWTPLWCAECDQERRETLTQQFAAIRAAFDEEPRHAG